MIQKLDETVEKIEIIKELKTFNNIEDEEKANKRVEKNEEEIKIEIAKRINEKD